MKLQTFEKIYLITLKSTINLTIFVSLLNNNKKKIKQNVRMTGLFFTILYIGISKTKLFYIILLIFFLLNYFTQILKPLKLFWSHSSVLSKENS